MLSIKKKILIAVFAMFVFIGLNYNKASADIYGDWQYTVNPDGINCTITGYTGTDMNINIPDTLDIYSVSNIGAFSFRYKALESVEIPNSVKSIENEAFSGCSYLADVTLNDGLISIGEYAFESCTSLTSIVIPNSVDEITNDAFSSCYNLSSVKLPDNLTTIDNSVFSYCTSLNYIELPDSITIINNNVFSGSGLISIEIPNSVTSIGQNAFSACENLVSVTLPNSITSIKDYTFFLCTSLTTIDIPTSVTSIGFYAFGYSGLTEIIVPNSVITIERYAFHRCANLVNVDLADSVLDIGEEAFSYNPNITYVKLSNNLISIGDYAFYSCENLISINIPNSVTNIGTRAFAFCTSLSSVTLSNSITEIKDLVFYECKNLSFIDIPDSVTQIGEEVFFRCFNLESVKLSNNLTTIKKNAFYDCTSLTTVTIPASVTYIGQGAFTGCTNLLKLIIEGENLYEDDAFRQSPNIKTLIFMGENPSINCITFNSQPIEIIWCRKGNQSHYETMYEPNYINYLPTTMQVKEFPYVIYDVYDPFTDTAENGEESIYYNVTDWDLELNGITDRSGEPLELKWYTDDNYTTPYTIGDLPIINIEEPVYLYARYEPLTYDITYHNLNGAENSNPTEYAYGTGLTLATPGERTGYDFIGWYDSDSDGNQVTAISNTDSGDKELWAVWDYSIYNITYHNLNGAEIPIQQSIHMELVLH